MRKQSDKTDSLNRCNSCVHYHGQFLLCSKWILIISEDKAETCKWFKKQTCKNCVHFTEREFKPWRTDPDLGHCVTNEIDVHKDCPVNKWCDNKFRLRSDHEK